jgi:hypothetical protein
MDRGGLVMEGIAAGLEAGLSPSDCLSTIARAGPAMARLSRQLEEQARGGPLASAIAMVLGLTADERAVITIGEEAGKLASALRWVITRRQARRTRRRAILSVVIAPLVIGVLTLLLEPLPGVVMGTGSFVPMIRALVGAALAVVVLAAVLRHVPSRLVGRVPIIRSLSALASDLETAALIGTFADGATLGTAPKAVRAIVDAERASALDRAMKEPSSTLAGFTERLSVVLAMGQRVGDLPARARAFEAAAAASLTARLRAAARVLAWTFAIVATIHATRLVMQLQLPSLGGDLNSLESPEMRELMKELENAGK